ncbi:MAG: glycosyltransferase [Chthoniobacterales bacterium]|nr:MAG: glycosyltransferase [Chthoniobacterales bacterium]
MKVSVVVPSFNQGPFLHATLDSLLIQDCPVEVLVFDGGSTDETLSVLQRYDNEVQFVSRKDDGQADAINQGLQMAGGEILAYLNSDDIYYPGCLWRVVQYFEKHPECQVLYGDAWHLHEDGSIMERYYTEPWSYLRLLEICYLCQPAVFWRREVMEHFGLFDVTLQYALDYDYWLRVGVGLDFHYLEGAYLAGSRLHQGTKTLKHRVKAHHEILEVVMRHGAEPPYRWLMNLSSVIVETARLKNGDGEIDEGTRRGLLIEAAIENADLHHIPLRADFLTSLEQMLPASEPI